MVAKQPPSGVYALRSRRTLQLDCCQILEKELDCCEPIPTSDSKSWAGFMSDSVRTAGAHRGAHSGESHRSVVGGFLALWGPRPGFIFSTQRRETDWNQWQEGDRHFGLARFAIGSNGWLDKEPLQAAPRKKPCQVSSRQWGEH